MFVQINKHGAKHMTHFVMGERYIDKTNEKEYIFDCPCVENELQGNFTNDDEFFLFTKDYANMTAVPCYKAERYIDNYQTIDNVRWVKLTHVNPYIEQLNEAETEIKRLNKLVDAAKGLASSMANDIDKLNAIVYSTANK
jgi:hypothetical protein